MNINDLKPASALALRLGVKCVAYGPPGSGKTPISNTAPNPVMLVTEPGMLSMRKSPIQHAYDAYTPDRIDQFFEWFFKSAETKNFDTLTDRINNQSIKIFGFSRLKEPFKKLVNTIRSVSIISMLNRAFSHAEHSRLSYQHNGIWSCIADWRFARSRRAVGHTFNAKAQSKSRSRFKVIYVSSALPFYLQIK